MSGAHKGGAVSRRTVLAGSAAATAALSLPGRALAAGGPGFPVMATLSILPDVGNPARAARLIAAVAGALAETGADQQRTWVLVDA